LSMNEMMDVLMPRQRRVLVLLAVLLAAAFFFLVIGSGRQRLQYQRSDSALTAQQAAFDLKRAGETEQNTWKRWDETLRDMEELKEGFFYSREQGVEVLRNDLKQILDQAGLRVSHIKYDYLPLEKESMLQVRLTFRVTGFYIDLKKFIHGIESFPGALLIEQIDFLDIDTRSGEIGIKVVLAGYYD